MKKIGKVHWRLAIPAADVLGDIVQMVHVHFSLHPEPVLHIAYNICMAGPDDSMDCRKTVTHVVPLGQLAKLNAERADARQTILRGLLLMSYELLRESGQIDNGLVTEPE